MGLGSGEGGLKRRENGFKQKDRCRQKERRVKKVRR